MVERAVKDYEWEGVISDVWTLIKAAQDRDHLTGKEKKDLVIRSLQQLCYSPATQAVIPHLVEGLVAAWKAPPPPPRAAKPKRKCWFFS